MINVLLICSQGASTSIMCDRIKQEAAKNNKEMDIKAVALAIAPDYISKADIILLGPQIRYMKKKVQQQAGDTPVLDIEMQTYGMMNGEKVYKQIMEVLHDERNV